MRNSAQWLLPIGLLALSAIPLAGGAVRLAELWGGAEITPGNARFFASPAPAVLHVLSSAVFSILGAFQFAAGFRRRRPGWHRAAGRILTACGLVAGLTGVWMTLFYPPVEGDGDLLYVFRLAFGAAMAACMVLGYTAIRRGDIARHRAWMTRGYAIGVGAGTQALVHIPWLMLGGSIDEFSRELLLGAGWAINLAVAEWSIRRRSGAQSKRGRQSDVLSN
ncbi:MAG TPA: DUF2306 domain-containing protein [Paucimonas sp.]|nr:DUF2306 domain-containing protein [Paucimonas sp.]